MEHAAWPALPYGEWAPTKKTLQACAQMLGKARLALAPPQPEWLHTSLQLDSRGFSTPTMPQGERIVSMGLDVYDGTMWMNVSGGAQVSIPIWPDRCVADIWTDFTRRLLDLGVDIDIWDKPQEVPDLTPFSQNTHDCTIVPEHAQRFHRVLCSLDGVFEEFRSGFFGRTGVQFWWGAFDFSVLLFSGEKEIAPDDRGYIMRYDLDADHMNAGFWVDDDSSPEAGFYAYIYPRPDGCETAPIEPEPAGWVESMGEWMMPYEAVRTSDDPRKAVLSFLTSVYQVAITQGGWDKRQFTYSPPAPSTRS
ncbi:MAG: DUF5996 family protein [Actinomycetia bacterium]|nr:DUF5996 family protein [Actinomycetes bacterium]